MQFSTLLKISIISHDVLREPAANSDDDTVDNVGEVSEDGTKGGLLLWGTLYCGGSSIVSSSPQSFTSFILRQGHSSQRNSTCLLNMDVVP